MERIQAFLEGGIDPTTQHQLEWYSQIYLSLCIVIAFVTSFMTGSVLLALEIFAGCFLVLLLLAVPPWPFLNRYPIKFLPVRKSPS